MSDKGLLEMAAKPAVLTAQRKPFTAAQRERLYLNADANIVHSMTLAAFHRVVQYVEAAQ